MQKGLIELKVILIQMELEVVDLTQMTVFICLQWGIIYMLLPAEPMDLIGIKHIIGKEFIDFKVIGDLTTETIYLLCN